MNSKNARMPLKTALGWIFFSTLLISGMSFLSFLYYLYLKEQRSKDDRYRIIALVQTCPKKECLKTEYLAELLNLSTDHPMNLYQFNSQEAREKLLKSPLIKEATVKKISPGTIYVDYDLRIPIAFWGNYANTAIDAEGYAFPFKPFFTPKKLPEVFVGETEEDDLSPWGKKIAGKNSRLMVSLLDLINKMCVNNGTQLLRLDVSNAYSPSHGQRQVVVMFEDQAERIGNGKSQLLIQPRILRLSSENISQQLANYFILRSHLMEKEKQESIESNEDIVTRQSLIIDLRIPELAFIAKDAL